LIQIILISYHQDGEYEIIINATSKSPVFSDWAKINIEVEPFNQSGLEELIIFIEEFIVENPECVEITEIVNEAKEYFKKGDLLNARLKAEQAVNACKEAISQVCLPAYKPNVPFGLSEYLVIISIIALLVGLFYYFIKRRKYKGGYVKIVQISQKPESFVLG